LPAAGAELGHQWSSLDPLPNATRVEREQPLPPSNRRLATPVLPFTRAVFLLGMTLTAGTGVALFAMPSRTADYWAWTIRAAPSVAFFGAAYVGAAVSLGLAARTREWQLTRVVAVVAVTLTSLVLIVTLSNLAPFAFGEGGVTEAVAWFWLAVYVALPPLALTAFVIQERTGGSREYGVELAALGATRLVLGGAGALLGAVGIGLLAGWTWLETHWPWPLPGLPAGIVGAWLCTYAAGFLWFALRERDWRRVRIGVLPLAIAIALDLAATGRLQDDFDGDAPTAVYLAALSALLVVLGAAALVEERRLRSAADA
jgi:hypothetical protein